MSKNSSSRSIKAYGTPLIVFILAFSLATSSKLYAEDEPNPNKRIYNQQSAVTIKVKSFSFENLKSFPDYNIYKEDIEKLVEEKRRSLNGMFNIESFQLITQLISQQYRQAGFVLTTAYIPEQEVNNENVKIAMFYGDISTINIEGNKLYSNKIILKPFKKIIGKPAQTKDIETAMLHLNDYPGTTATSLFVPGKEAGTSTLIIKSANERSLTTNISYDNYGSELTGENRLTVAFDFNNITKHADLLKLNIVQTINPGNSLYGSLDYSLPVWRPGYSIGLNLNNNSYAVGDIFEPLDIEGDSNTFGVFGKAYWLRKKSLNIFSVLNISQKNSTSASGAFLSDTENNISTTSLTTGFNGDDNWLTGRHGGQITYTSGTSETELSGDSEEESFSKINLNYQHAFPLTFSEKLRNTHLILKTDLQQSSNELSALEQMTLGGPYSVRAYPISEFLVDSGFLLSIEWVAKASKIEGYEWLDALQFVAFIDYASGKVNTENTNDPKADIKIKGVGFSVQSLPEQGIQARFDLGIPLGEPYENYTSSNDEDTQMFFSIAYQF